MTYGFILDIVFLVAILAIAIVNCVVGFLKYGLKNLLFLAEWVLIFVLSPILVGLLCRIPFIYDFAIELNAMMASELIPTIGARIVIIVLFAIIIILLAVICHFIIKPILKAAEKRRKKERGFSKFLDKLFGFLFAFAFWGVLILSAIGGVYLIGWAPAVEFISSSLTYKAIIGPLFSFIGPLG